MSNNNVRTVPKHLKHKPIYIVNGYRLIDGEYKNDTDVVGLSVGKAQWSDTFVPSVKVWRYVGDNQDTGRWSRQSEETTITRALDMATLILKVYNCLQSGEPLGKFDGPNVYGEKIEIEQTEQRELIQALKDYFSAHHADIDSHINILKQTLDSYKM